jgi:hypothetical protein
VLTLRWWLQICNLSLKVELLYPLANKQGRGVTKSRHFNKWDFSVHGSYCIERSHPHAKTFHVSCIIYHVSFFLMYEGCSKSIEPLVGKSRCIDLEIWNFNPLGDAHTSPSASAIFGNTPGTQFWNGVQLVRRILHDVLSWLKSGPFQHHFQLGK